VNPFPDPEPNPFAGDFVLTMPSFIRLREQAAARAREEPLAYLTVAEANGLGDLFAHHSKCFEARSGELWRSNPGLAIACRDIDDEHTVLPKWAQLAAWLTPESVAGSAPDFAAEVATLMFTHRLPYYRPPG
jgi:hypothetical protein